jgi:hypothetical protein
MSAATHPVHGQHGPPPRVRWPRRIAGLLATLALLAVAIAMAKMILPGGDSKADVAAAGAPAATGTHRTGHKRHAAAARQTAKLTRAGLAARHAAVTAVRSAGYEPVSLKPFDPRHALRVLVAHPAGDSLGARRAFFFRASGPVGTDAPTGSSGLRVASTGKDWVTLAYGIYAFGDRSCCPSGGRVKVRFGWTGGALAPVGGTIPASDQRVAGR